jgi:hypothetical protein
MVARMAILISLGSKRHAALAQLRWRPHILGVIPANAGIEFAQDAREKSWTPAFSGVTLF